MRKDKQRSVLSLLLGIFGLVLYSHIFPWLVAISALCLIPPYILAWKMKTGVFEPWKND